jgi:hypothetical protein
VALSVPDNEGGQQYECLCGQLFITPARTGQPARLVPVQRDSGGGTRALWVTVLVLLILGVAVLAGYTVLAAIAGADLRGHGFTLPPLPWDK